LKKQIIFNGNCVFSNLSHSRGSPQGSPQDPGLKRETWATRHSTCAWARAFGAPATCARLPMQRRELKGCPGLVSFRFCDVAGILK
jgi:hypothetical protein